MGSNKINDVQMGSANGRIVFCVQRLTFAAVIQKKFVTLQIGNCVPNGAKRRIINL